MFGFPAKQAVPPTTQATGVAATALSLHLATPPFRVTRMALPGLNAPAGFLRYVCRPPKIHSTPDSSYTREPPENRPLSDRLAQP